MINVDKSRVAVSGDLATIMTEFIFLVNNLQVELLKMGNNEDRVNAFLARAFFMGMAEHLECDEKPIPEGGLTDDK